MSRFNGIQTGTGVSDPYSSRMRWDGRLRSSEGSRTFDAGECSHAYIVQITVEPVTHELRTNALRNNTLYRVRVRRYLE